MKHTIPNHNQPNPHIIHISSSLKRGGAEALLYETVIHLKNKGIQQTVLYFHAGPYVTKLEQNGIAVYQVRGLFCVYDPLFWFRLLQLTKQLKPTGIHGWLWAANVASRLLQWCFKIPVINSIHNNVEQDGFVRNTIDRLTLKQSTALVAVSNGVSHSIAHRYSMGTDKIITIPNGINAVAIAAQADNTTITRSSLGCNDTHFIIGTVGRFVPEKNIALLLHAVAELITTYNHLRVIIVGVGPEEAALRKLAHALDLSDYVQFFINQPATSFYKLFDCFVLSSYKEGISMALLEAMSCNVACITTNTTVTHDVLTDNYDGIVVQSNNKKALHNAISFVIENPQQRIRLSQNGYTTVTTKFSSAVMLSRYCQLYNQLGIAHSQV